METKSESTRRTQPVALFMAFGTKGDVYPISAIAAAFAFDQEQYRVVLVTHSAHKNFSSHLAAKNVEYLPVSSPPVLSPCEDDGPAGTVKLSFSLQKRRITKEHRLECISNVERIFGVGPSLEGDFIVINFFALVGALQNFFMSVALLLLLMSFLTVPLHHLSVTSKKSFHFYMNIFKKLLLTRLDGKMLSTGCGHFLLKIGDRGEVLS